MDAHSPSFDADALLAEAGYLHALARELAVDAHAADDLVQDTLLTALERPPRRDEGARGLRGWLATVLRNRARQRHRGDDRRRAREQHVARSEATEVDAGDVEARMLLLRRLADAIAALPEPQRSAVTMRWIDGRTPAEVARAQGITPEAARQRLSRATAMLRQALDRDYRDRIEWSAIALVLPRATSTAKTTSASAAATKGILMPTTMKVGGAAVLVLLAIVLVSRPWKDARSDVGGMDTHGGSSARATGKTWTQDPQTGRAVEMAPADNVREAAIPRASPQPASAIDRDRDLHGVVLDPLGRPVSGARIEVTHRDSDGYGSFDFAEPMPPVPAPLVGTTTSSEDGTFAIALPPGRLHALRVHSSGFADARFGNCCAGERVVVHMSRGGSVHVVVTRKSNGSPVEGALVHGYPWTVGHALGDAEREFFARTDVDGRYEAKGVLPGTFRIIVQPTDAPDPESERIDVAEDADVALDFVVESGKTLRGRVTDAETGAPIYDALVGQGFWIERYAHTDRNGEYEYKGFPERQVRTIGVIADGYGQQSVTVPVIDKVNAQTVDVKLLRGRVLRCRIVARDGTPLAGATATAFAYGDEKKNGEIDERTSTSGPDGKIRIGGLRTDLPHVLFARKEGFGTAVHDLPANELEENAVDLGDVALDPMAIVSGVVVDAKGAPIAAHPVHLIGSNADRAAPGAIDPKSKRTEASAVDRFVAVRTARTDDLGRFTFADVAPGEFRVRAWIEGVSEPVEVGAHVAAGARTTGLKIVLDEGLSIEGDVFGPDGNPVEKASLSTHCFVGWQSKKINGETRRVGGHDVNVTAETDARGHFRIVGLTEGVYTLSVFCWDEHAETRFAPGEAKSVPAGTRDVIVRLRKVARIEGVVQEDDGTPVPFATVSADVGIPGATPIFERGQSDGSFFVDVAEGDVADLTFTRPSNAARSGAATKNDSGHLRGIAAGTKGVVLRFPPH